MVLKGFSLSKKTWFAVKLYLPSALREFLYEREINQLLFNHPGIVSAVEYVSSSEISSPLVINGEIF